MDSVLRGIFLHVLDCTKERNFDDAILGSNNLETCIYRALKEDFYKADYDDISSKFIFDTVSYADAKNSLMNLVATGLCDTSTRCGLRFLEILSKNKNNTYIVKNLNTGVTFTCSRKLVENDINAIINYKLSKDNKLIKRFK